MSDAVEIKNISFSFNTPLGEHFVLNNISFSVAKGEFVTIAGPSGCGKSTLLSVIAGLLKPTEGVINIAQNQKCGYMLQKDYLFEWRSVFSNACLGEEIKGKLTPETRNFALSLFEKYGLKDYINSRPSALSGGMRQRAALIRTLVPKPDILLLDEPFSALDSITRISLQEWLLKEWEKHKKTILFVTHDVEEAIFLSQKIFVVSDRPITHFQEFKIDLPYPRNRADMARSDIAALKEMLIKHLRQEEE